MNDITSTIKYVFDFLKDLIDYIPVIPFDFKIIIIAIILGHLITRGDKAIQRYSTWILFIFMFYSTFKFWLI